jgi:hypothetical protein
MLCLYKTLHVLAVGLWFGAVVFFTVSGALMFHAFEEVSSKPEATSAAEDEAPGAHSANSRPMWFPVPAPFRLASPGEGFPDPIRKEQGSRAFGVAVGAVFPFYYGLQLACGLVCLVTAGGMIRSGAGSAGRWRIALCALAFATAGLGWWVETVVTDLRGPREKRTDAVLIASSPTPDQLAEARAARAVFGRWHGYSLLQNFVTLALVAAIAGMAAHLPGPPRP